MSQTEQGAPLPTSLDDVVTTLRSSVLLSMATFGVFMIALGLFIDTITTPEMSNWRTWSAIFGVWGIALVVLGTVLYGIIWWQRR